MYSPPLLNLSREEAFFRVYGVPQKLNAPIRPTHLSRAIHAD